MQVDPRFSQLTPRLLSNAWKQNVRNCFQNLLSTATCATTSGMFTDRTYHGNGLGNNGDNGNGGYKADRGYKAGLVGWMLEPRSFLVVAYLALGPGLVGHTGGVLQVDPRLTPD